MNNPLQQKKQGTPPLQIFKKKTQGTPPGVPLSQTKVYKDTQKQNQIKKNQSISPVLRRSTRVIPKKVVSKKVVSKKPQKKQTLPQNRVPKYIPTIQQQVRKQYSDFDNIKQSHDLNLSIYQTTTQQKEEVDIDVPYFLNLLDDPDGKFCDSLTNSSRLLLNQKFIFYQKKMVESNEELEIMYDKADRLRKKNVDDEQIGKTIPIVDGILKIIELEQIIDLVAKKIYDANPDKIRINLRNAINNKIDGLASIVGRDHIKNQFIGMIYAFAKSWKTFFKSFNNIALFGSAGAGKTQLAKVLANLFAATGILATNKVNIVSRTDLVGQYMGETALKTKTLLINSLESILVIDEAYQLTPCPGPDKAGADGQDYGPEAITEMVNFLDKYIGMSVVMVIGYKDLMTRCFFTINEGLNRRFPYQFELSNYPMTTLTRILIRFIESKSDLVIDQTTANAFYTILCKIKKEDPDAFKSQAGDMMNLGTSIVQQINLSVKKSWKSNDLDNNRSLILAGFNSYLKNKRLLIRIATTN